MLCHLKLQTYDAKNQHSLNQSLGVVQEESSSSDESSNSSIEVISRDRDMVLIVENR